MPRANLNLEVILSEAARMADELGLDQISMAALAKRFGVAVPSLYKHVASLGAVRTGLAVRGLNELAQALELQADEPSRAQALQSMAFAYRRFAHAHPGLYTATLRAPDAADAELRNPSERLLGIVYQALDKYGLQGEQAVHGVRMLRAALHGFVSLEAAGGFGMPLDVDRSFRRMIDALDASFRSARGPNDAASSAPDGADIGKGTSCDLPNSTDR